MSARAFNQSSTMSQKTVQNCVPKIIKVRGNLTKFWQRQFCTVFLWTRCRYDTNVLLYNSI